MTKSEFLWELRKKLSGLPDEDILRSLDYYGEIIDDCVEDGLEESAAVESLGSLDSIADQILKDIPLPKLVKEKIKPKRTLRAWEIVLIVLGSPVWLPLLIAAVAVVLSLYAVLWSLIISVWAVFGSVAGVSVGGIFAGTAFALTGNALPGIAMIGAALASAGLSVFIYFGCISATKGTFILTKKIALGIKKCFVKKEGAK